MKRIRNINIVVCLLSLLLANTAYAAALSNGGFETTEVTGGGIPTTFGDWLGDESAIVTAQDGIDPLEGSQMLRFISTNSSYPSVGSISSDVVQLIDMSSYITEISAGLVSVSSSAYFNRIAFDSYTDTLFWLQLRAFAGDPVDFPSQVHLATSAVELVTDAELATWEVANTELTLPVDTDYVAVVIRAIENVQNDGLYPEFDGHYADNVSLSISVAPEPISSTLFLIGGATLGFRRFRKKKRNN